MPHGHCLRWIEYLVGTFVVADLLTWAGYLSFTSILFYFAYTKFGNNHNLLFFLLGGVFLFCGLDNLYNAINITGTYYYQQSAIKWIKAIVMWAFIARFYFCWGEIVKSIYTNTEVESLEHEVSGLEHEVSDLEREVDDLEDFIYKKEGEFFKLRELLKEDEANKVVLKENIRTLLEYVPLEIARFDKDMNYIFASGHFRKQHSLPDDVVGKNHYQLLPEVKNQSEWVDIHNRVKEGEYIYNPLDRFQGKYLSWHCIPTENGGQIHFSIPLQESVERLLDTILNHASFNKKS